MSCLKRHRLALPFTVLLGLCACTVQPTAPDYAEQARESTQQVSGWEQLDEAMPVTTLNALIDSAQLDTLVQQALANNPGLQSTLITLEIRRAERRQSSAALRPSVEAGFSGEKTEDTPSSYTGSLSVSWELDVWQQLADGVKAAELDVAQQAALTQSARDTLAAEIMQAWLQLIAQQHSLDIEQRRLQTQQQNEGFILQRYRSGLGNLEDLDSARSSTASTRATIEELNETYQQQLRSLRNLLGQIHLADDSVATADYPAVILPLAELPTQTLQRRPDLKAAYLAIQAADLRATVAYKDLLPSISLQASLTDNDGSPREALLSNPLWTVLGQLTAPLYQGGQLRAAAEIADLDVALAYQDYRDTLLTAVTEVENALGLERSLQRRQQHIDTALATARNNLAHYQRRYRSGLVDILDLLEVQQQTYDLELQLDELIYQRLTNRIALGLALGLGARDISTAQSVIIDSGVNAS